MPDQPAGDNLVQPTDQPQTPTADEPKPSFMDTGSMAPPPPPPNAPPSATGNTPPPAAAAEAPGGPPVVTTATPPKPKKKVKGRVIATILGILFLVGGVTAGVLLVQEQQELREEAAGTTYMGCDENGKCVEKPCSTVAGKVAMCADVCHTDSDCGVSFKTPPPSGDGGDDCASQYIKCYSYECPQGCTIRNDCCCGGAFAGTHLCAGAKNGEGGGNCVCKAAECRSNRKEVSCSHQPSPCGQVDKIGKDGKYCGQVGTQCTNGTQPCDGGGGSEINAQCINVKAYDTSNKELTSQDLANLTTGDQVVFIVKGTTNSGKFDRAVMWIAGERVDISTPTTSNASAFSHTYTIKDTDLGKKITVTAWIHHQQLNNWAK